MLSGYRRLFSKMRAEPVDHRQIAGSAYSFYSADSIRSAAFRAKLAGGYHIPVVLIILMFKIALSGGYHFLCDIAWNDLVTAEFHFKKASSTRHTA